jgi:hypothetical protein
MKDDKIQLEPRQKKSKNKKPVLSLLIILALVGISAGSYYIGLRQGEKKGAEALTAKIADTLNPLNVLSNNPVFPNSAIGPITKVESDSITVRQANGNEKKLLITDRTQITQKTNTLSAKDLKKDQQVTVIFTKESNKEKATRIIVR